MINDPIRKLYIQHAGKVIETDSHFSHVMAIALDPRKNYLEGVVRCITSREGDVTTSGYIDRSELHKVSSKSLENFKIDEKLDIRNEVQIISRLTRGQQGALDFIGLEDPDIWIDEGADLMHLYFTLPMIDTADHEKNHIHLGHAVGKDIESLGMTVPALIADDIGGAKELSVAPINSRGLRYNLVESSKKESDFTYWGG